MAAHANAIPIPAADGFIFGTGPGGGTPQILYGWSIEETAAAAAEMLIRDGSVTGTILGVVKIGATSLNPTSTVWFGDRGIRAPGGIFIDRVAGALAGSVYVG